MDSTLFKNLDIHAELKEALEQNNFIETTAVQTSVIPEFLRRDVIVQSQTGSGKTLAYLIPILNILYKNADLNNNSKKETSDDTKHLEKIDNLKNENIISDSKKETSDNSKKVDKLDNSLDILDNSKKINISSDSKKVNLLNLPFSLIIVPTRELSIQISEILKIFKFKSEIFIGGTSMEEDLEKLKNKFSIAIGTPGRLQEIISTNSKVFSKLKYVVLDESDKLLSFGFESKLQRILAFLPKNRITGLFSATMNESINKLSLSFLKNPISITVTEQIPEKLTLKYLMTSPTEKLDYLIPLIKDKKSIVFFSTCNTTEFFFNLIKKILNTGIAFHKIHGKMDQRDRSKIYSEFDKTGGVLFCTDVAARGIDFKGIDLVIHFDVPKDHENIVHRSGRTARNGNEGESILFLMKNERSLIEFLKLKGITMEETRVSFEENNRNYDNDNNESDVINDNKGNKDIDSKNESIVDNKNNNESVVINESIIDNKNNNESVVINESAINNKNNNESVVINESIIDNKVINKNNKYFNMGKSEMTKELLELSVKSFVSYIRGYKEHILNYILNFKELDFDELVEMHYLERIPSMPETRNVKFRNFEKPEQVNKKKFKRN